MTERDGAHKRARKAVTQSNTVVGVTHSFHAPSRDKPAVLHANVRGPFPLRLSSFRMVRMLEGNARCRHSAACAPNVCAGQSVRFTMAAGYLFCEERLATQCLPAPWHKSTCCRPVLSHAFAYQHSRCRPVDTRRHTAFRLGTLLVS